MKKKIMIITLLLVIGGVIGITYKMNSKNPTENSGISIYLQKEEGGKDYDLSPSNEFPTDGYVLNRGDCENGANVTQNPETKSINVSVTGSTKCTLYFDKKIEKPLTIESVEVDAESEYNTVKLTVNATGGTGKYNYSVENTCTHCDDPAEKCGIDSTNPNISIKDNIITISNLEDFTFSRYRQSFVVKVSDGQNEQTYPISNIETTGYCSLGAACDSNGCPVPID